MYNILFQIYSHYKKNGTNYTPIIEELEIGIKIILQEIIK